MIFTEYITEASKFILEQLGVIMAIEQSCQPFLREWKNTGNKNLLWRGTYAEINKSLKQIIPRTNREPTDMPPELHNMLDSLFYKKFKWHPRSEGVFTSNKSMAGGYGNNLSIFFPVGEYEYLYNPNIKDLYTEIGQEFSDAEDHKYDWEFEYEHEYKKGKRGTWYYDGIDTEENFYGDAINVAAEAEGVDLEDIDAMKMEWVPEIDIDEYMQQREAEYNEQRDENLEDIILGYTNKNLKKAISSQVEIMFKCKSYFIVKQEFEKSILDYLLKDKLPIDLNQLELEFESNPKMRRNISNLTKFTTKPLYMMQTHNKKFEELLRKIISYSQSNLWVSGKSVQTKFKS